ncbi:sporulation protein YqfD [Bacillus marinisedimentorum]|uniref:sporulation protein YqfD n=1 Tax=Bacillus marinisedimentorum TaxID=1821260 RepID=UPI000872E642|nr:sporulation protein YqfD [Bacillus marinisedimentorum]
MKNQWIHYFTGYITVEIRGTGAERFLNRCMREGIYIWNVKRLDESVLTGKVRLEDVSRLRNTVRSSGCKLSFKSRHGLPFFMRRIFSNTGIAAGGLFFLIIFALLSNMVWGIEIEGADPQTEHHLRNVLKENGIEKGSFHFNMPDNDEIQTLVMSKMENITWIGVRLNGTTYHLQVVQKEQPEEDEQTGRKHLVAARKAVVRDLFVEQGQAQVEVNDFVDRGQLLVSGIIGSEDHNKVVGAKGEVLGETWYKSRVSIPLETTFNVLTGEHIKKWRLEAGSFRFPVWGFWKKHEFAQYEAESTVRPLYFFKIKLPLNIAYTTIYETESVTRTYTLQEAKNKAIQAAEDELMQKLEKEAIIKDEKVLQLGKQDGKVNVIIHFTVIENIVREQTINQGD